MVELVIGPLPKDRLKLRAERQIIQGKRWVFDTVIPRDQWEDLFSVNAPDGRQMSSKDAYEHARVFWDHLADKKADEQMGSVDPASHKRQIEYVWPNLGSLERAYNDFQQPC